MCRLLLFVFPLLLTLTHGGNLIAQIQVKSMAKLPDTGQTKSFTDLYGEDSDYTINPPIFTDHQNGTMTDNVTGLMWQKTDGGEMTHEQAKLYCENLQLANYQDWRMPTAQELFSILNHNNNNPALDPLFTKTGAEYWWSSQDQVNDKNKAWVVNAGGGIGNHPKAETISSGGSKKFHVRAVRDIQQPLEQNRYTLTDDLSLIDHFTGLQWKADLSDSVTWEEAIASSESAEELTFSDWRLPNIKELQTLSSVFNFNPSVHPIWSDRIRVGKFWSSTSLSNQVTKAWYWDTRYGITTFEVKSRKLYYIKVRTYSISNPTKQESQYRSARVYPNPAATKIFLMDGQGDLKITIYDPKGSIVIEENDFSSIDISSLENGIYLVCIQMHEYCMRQWLIKQD